MIMLSESWANSGGNGSRRMKVERGVELHLDQKRKGEKDGQTRMMKMRK